MNPPLTHYCIVRKDMPLGDICAQLVHAAGESSTGSLPSDTFAVVLSAKNERELLKIESKLQQAGIQYKIIRESDAPFNGAATAIGVKPCCRDEVKPYLRSLQLLR